MKIANRVLLLTLAGSMLPTAASAHPDAVAATGWMHGFEHPLGGVDHIVAMIAVGALAARLGGRALIALPVSFLTTMAAGGVAGALGLDLPLVEAGIIASVFILGFAAFVRIPIPALVAVPLVGACAFLHGLAHGMEMPSTASGIAYGTGFLAATGILHLTGIGLQLALARLWPLHRDMIGSLPKS